jgi:hypothetical protein
MGPSLGIRTSRCDDYSLETIGPYPGSKDLSTNFFFFLFSISSLLFVSLEVNLSMNHGLNIFLSDLSKTRVESNG